MFGALHRAFPQNVHLTCRGGRIPLDHPHPLGKKFYKNENLWDPYGLTFPKPSELISCIPKKEKNEPANHFLVSIEKYWEFSYDFQV